MSNLIQSRNETASVHVGPLGVLTCRIRIYLRSLESALGAFARFIAAPYAAVGEAARMVYVDPYKRDDRDRW